MYICKGADEGNENRCVGGCVESGDWDGGDGGHLLAGWLAG